MQRVIVIADDLTGAMDTGLQFSKRGLETRVAMSWQQLPQQAQVVVLDTDSRAIGASQAYARLRQVATLAMDARIFKKVDSTMRGNVGYELRALYEVLEPRAVVVAPAFPRGGRTTFRGRQRVDGRGLELTFFAHDPRWPMRESYLPALLMQQSGYEVGLLPLEALENGSAAAARALQALPQRIIVADALTDDHLAIIAEAVAELGEGWIPCGSAGLAEPWADAIGLVSRGQVEGLAPAQAPLLFVSGSRNDATQRQLERLLADEGPTVVEVDPYASFDQAAEVRRLAEAVQEALGLGQDVVLEGTLAPLVPGAGPLVARVLAQAVARVAAGAAKPGGLFLTGGDIAVATCRELGVTALRILHEVQSGIPGGALIGGVWDGLAVVTKAGGFGDDQALVMARDYLRSGSTSAHR